MYAIKCYFSHHQRFLYHQRVCKMQVWINGYVTKTVVKVIIKSHWSPRLAGFLSVVHS